MEWGRWLIGVVERDEQCRFCRETIHRGERVAVEEEVMEVECITCHWERIRALTKASKPKPKPKGDRKMPWQKVAPGQQQMAGTGTPNGKLQPIQKWTTGTILEGKIVGRRENKNGPLMDFLDEKMGLVVYSIPVLLGYQLENVADGQRCRIECKGKVPTRNGNQAWSFESFVDA